MRRARPLLPPRLFVLAALAAPVPASAQAPAGDVLLVGNKQDNDLSVIEIASGRTVARVPTGLGPHEVAVSPDGRWAVVANYGAQQPGNTLTVIDLEKLKGALAPEGGAVAVSATIDLGDYRRPHGLAFFPDGKRLAFTSEVARVVGIVDLEKATVTGSIGTDAGGSHMLAIAPDGGRIYTANIPDATVSVLDVAGGKVVGKYPAGAASEGIGLSPDGRELWVGSNEEGNVRVLDAATGAQLALLEAPGVPIRAYFDPAGARVLVPSAQAGVVRVFDAKARQPIGSIDVGGTPIGITFNEDGSRAYVARNSAGEVAEIDVAALRVLRAIPTGNGPDAIARSAYFR